MIDVNKAKQKILDLAIRGKLTKQLKSDGNAADLLVEIQKEKAKLIKYKKIRNDTNVISDDIEEPFEIPENWVWCRFDELYDINPEVIANKNDKAAFIPMEKIGAGYENKFDYIIQDWEAASKAHTKFCDGDVCFAKISPCFENRKSFIANNLPNGIGGGTTELIVIRQNKVLKEFTYLIVLDERFIFECSKSYKGVVGQQRIKRDILDNYLIPLPPLAEQKRIVEKVEHLFDILDKIDEAQKKYQKDKDILKSKIIEAGIRGKLTKQLKSDGDASDLLDEIRKEKEKLIKEGKIKRDKKETYIYKNPKDNLYYEKYQDGSEKCIQDELPFDIPENWEWCHLNNISYNVGNTSNQIKTSEIQQKGEVPVVSQGQDMIDGYTNEINKIINNVPIILFGDHTRCVKYIDFDFVVGADGVKLHKVVKCDDKYIYYWMKLIAKQMISNGYARHHSLLLEEIVPIPPLTEQERIVKRIEELFNTI